MKRCLAAAAVLALGVALSAQTQAPKPPQLPGYESDVEARIAAAMARARAENRRVLVLWGSNSDQASKDLMEIAARDRSVLRTLSYEYEVVRAEFEGNRSVAAKYEATGALPRMTVLDNDGSTLANRPAVDFKADSKAAGANPFDAGKINEFLAGFKPAYGNAEEMFESALNEAKKEQKALFLWFSAPW